MRHFGDGLPWGGGEAKKRTRGAPLAPETKRLARRPALGVTRLMLFVGPDSKPTSVPLILVGWP